MNPRFAMYREQDGSFRQQDVDRLARWLARFEAEVRGEEREEIERLAKPYEEMTANETVAALRPYWRDAAETFWRMKRAPCEPTCTCDGDPIFVLAVLLKRYAAALRGGGSRSEEGRGE